MGGRNDNDGDDDEFIEQSVEIIKKEQGDGDDKDDDTSEDEDDNRSEDANEDESKPANKTVWFEIMQIVINHMREVNFHLIYVLGTILFLDEMMIQFMGRSLETYRI